METLSKSEPKKSYSWWWDSHKIPNSKWLHENIADIDGKVKSMIKLIEEDADSFARRAEMYYKKRPELMKLVEEFYRAYRALAEKYNNATGELRHAHRAIAKTFPDQGPSKLVEDSSPQEKDGEDSFYDEVMQLSTEYQTLKERILQETERAEKAEDEAQGLKKFLTELQSEKESVLLQYQQCLQQLSRVEEELTTAQKDSATFNEKASSAEIEVQTLKETLVQLEMEKTTGLIRQKDYLEKISHLEAMVSQFEEDTKALDNRAIEAEAQTQTLKDEISRLKHEKELEFHEHQQCLSRISDLEGIISFKENEVRLLKEQAESAETEVYQLKETSADLNKEKEASALQYRCCLETISKLEKDISSAKDDVKRLNDEILVRNAKLKSAEGKCTVLELSNQTLRVEADNLTKRIAAKDQELLKKQEELEKLQVHLQEEHLHKEQVAATLHTVQGLQSQSQDERRSLEMELKNLLHLLKEMEASKNGLEQEIGQVRDENRSLSQANLSSVVSIENLQNEIICLKEIREKLEKEVSHYTGKSMSLQQEILCLKEDIDGLNRSYQALVEQVEAAGLNPNCVVTSVKGLEEGLKKMVVESALSDLNSELERSHEKVKTLQESCQLLHGEKATLVGEKAALLSQLQAITENMRKMLEKNAVMENSLSTAKVELEGLREKSKGLEQICELLKNERSYLITERDALISKLGNVEKKFETMEERFIGLEGKYADLLKEKESMHSQVEKLGVSLGMEQEQRTSSQALSETRLAGLANQIHLLEEENRSKKKESVDEIDKSLKAQFEISILQKFIKEMENKNSSLIIECQKHVEASKLAEKVISELESESLEQQVEAELLLDEIERLRLGIYQIFRVLETDQDYAPEDKAAANEHAFVHHILEYIEDMKCSMSEHENDKQRLAVENSVLVALLQQLESNGKKIESQKIQLEQQLNITAKKLAIANKEKEKLHDLNRQLGSEVSKGHQDISILEAELASLGVKQADMEKAYNALEGAYSQVKQENICLLKKLLDLKEEKCQVDLYNDAILLDCVATASKSEVLMSFGVEKVTELKLLLEDLNRQHGVNSVLEKETKALRRKLELQKAENLILKDSVHNLKREIQKTSECNTQMDRDIVNGKESLNQTMAKLLDTEIKLEAAEDMSLKLSTTVAKLETEISRSLQMKEDLERSIIQLSGNNHMQKMKIESLQIINKNLESELRFVRQEIEENTMRELTLSMELHDMNNEFEICEAEAESFCFDLQVSSIQEILLKNKMQELSDACKTLEREYTTKTSEFEQMKGKVCSMEGEISGLKSKLYSTTPVIASLRDDITLLEYNVLLQSNKTKATDHQVLEFSDVAANPNRDASLMLEDDQYLISLKDLQKRVKAVAKLMEETNKPIWHARSNSKRKQESVACEPDQVKSHRSFGSKKKGSMSKTYDSPKPQKMKSKVHEIRNSMLMKDIPLDQVSGSSQHETLRRCNTGADNQILELWRVGESKRVPRKSTEWDRDIMYDDQFKIVQAEFDHPFADPDMEREFGMDYKLKLDMAMTSSALTEWYESDKKVMERLDYDANKLENLQITVQNLRTKWDSQNKKRRKALKNVDFDAINEHVQEFEDTIVQLMDLNGQLVNHIELCPHEEMASPRQKETVHMWRTKVIEQAVKESERIERLQFELQNFHYTLLKMEEDMRTKERGRFFRSRSITLRNFVHIGKKNTTRRKKSPEWTCFRQSPSRYGNTSY